MKKEKLSDLVRHLGPADPASESPKSDPETLDGYADGTLAPEVAERVREELSWSAESRAIVQDLKSFPELEAPRGHQPLGDDELESAWQRFGAGIDEGVEVRHEVPGGTLNPPMDSQPRRMGGRAGPAGKRWVRLEWAAGLMLATLGLGFWVIVLLDRVADLSAPKGVVSVVGLAPLDAAVRGTEWVNEISIVPGPMVWMLEVDPDLRPKVFEAALFRAEDKEPLWTARARRGSETSPVVLSLSSLGSSAPGDYRLLLYDVDSRPPLSLARPVAEYSLRLVPRAH